MKFREGDLEFDFGDSWVAVKYDDSSHHIKKMQLLDSKAVDFVAVHDHLTIFLEVKDFRGRRIENKEKLDGELVRDVAKKVRDSVAGVIGYRRCLDSASESPWSECCRAVAGAKKVLVVLFLETDSKGSGQSKPVLLVQQQLLKKAMAWASMGVMVVDRRTYKTSLEGVAVNSLPRGGSGIAS